MVNELTPELDTIEKSYVLVGIAKNSNNEPYVVSFVVNTTSNEITSIDVLYAVNAKKRGIGCAQCAPIHGEAAFGYQFQY